MTVEDPSPNIWILKGLNAYHVKIYPKDAKLVIDMALAVQPARRAIS